MSAADPVNSDILIVGANAATPFPPTIVERDRDIELLLAGGAELRELYARARLSRRPSPTRRNIDRASRILLAHGARGVVETNVWALPTKRLADLKAAGRSVREASARILPRLISILMPPSPGRARRRSGPGTVHMPRSERGDRTRPPSPHGRQSHRLVDPIALTARREQVASRRLGTPRTPRPSNRRVHFMKARARIARFRYSS
jgi:hypothetical protein